VTVQSDAALVRRVLDGETEAFADLVARYRDRLARYAVRMLGNHADAEEAVQDAFVRAYRSLRRCTDPERFGAWVFAILVNRCRTAGARRARRERTVVSDERLLHRAAVDDFTDRQAWRDAINWALAQVPPTNREAFLLKHVEELSYEEMRDATGVSIPALKMRVLRARETLRDLLKEVERV
jgi:RNA polymerase sigma-70 factor (ECF subfamily)